MKIFVSQPFHEKTKGEVMDQRKQVLDKYCRYVGRRMETIEVIDNWTAPDGMSRLWYLGRAIQLMAEADVVLFTNDWSKAKGCMIERHVCRRYGIPYFVERELE